MLHFVTPCFVTSTDQGVWTVSSCFVTNETNETDHQWELLLVCFILFHSFSVHFRVFLIYFNCFICFCYREKNMPKKKPVWFLCSIYWTATISAIFRSSATRRLHIKFEQHWPGSFRGEGFVILNIFPIQMYGAHTNAQESKLDLTLKRSNINVHHHFNNFGRSYISNDFCKDSVPRHPRFWRKVFFFKAFLTYMGMAAILINRPQPF